MGDAAYLAEPLSIATLVAPVQAPVQAPAEAATA